MTLAFYRAQGILSSCLCSKQQSRWCHNVYKDCNKKPTVTKTQNISGWQREVMRKSWLKSCLIIYSLCCVIATKIQRQHSLQVQKLHFSISIHNWTNNIVSKTIGMICNSKVLKLGITLKVRVWLSIVHGEAVWMLLSHLPWNIPEGNMH